MSVAKYHSQHTYVAEAGSHGMLDVQFVIPAWFVVFVFVFVVVGIFYSVLVDCGKNKSGSHDAPVHSAIVWMDMDFR